jgi:hypothetical protein
MTNNSNARFPRITATAASSALDVERHHFARFALGEDLERPAANLAVRGESLGFDAGIDDQIEALPAERTRN